MADKAKGLCWWAACRDVIAELKRRFREPFVPDSGQNIKSKREARDHICNSGWFSKLHGEAARSTHKDVLDLLASAHQTAENRIADGSWRQDFAGKEILRDVAG